MLHLIFIPVVICMLFSLSLLISSWHKLLSYMWYFKSFFFCFSKLWVLILISMEFISSSSWAFGWTHTILIRVVCFEMSILSPSLHCHSSNFFVQQLGNFMHLLKMCPRKKIPIYLRPQTFIACDNKKLLRNHMLLLLSEIYFYTIQVLFAFYLLIW